MSIKLTSPTLICTYFFHGIMSCFCRCLNKQKKKKFISARKKKEGKESKTFLRYSLTSLCCGISGIASSGRTFKKWFKISWKGAKSSHKPFFGGSGGLYANFTWKIITAVKKKEKQKFKPPKLPLHLQLVSSYLEVVAQRLRDFPYPAHNLMNGADFSGKYCNRPFFSGPNASNLTTFNIFTFLRIKEWLFQVFLF